MTISRGKTGPKSLTKNAQDGNRLKRWSVNANNSGEEKTSGGRNKNIKGNGSANWNGGLQAGAANHSRNRAFNRVTQRVEMA